MKDFEQLCKDFNLKMDHLKEMFLEAFPGPSEKNEKFLNMSHLEDIFFANYMNKLYKKVDLSNDEDEELGDF